MARNRVQSQGFLGESGRNLSLSMAVASSRANTRRSMAWKRSGVRAPYSPLTPRLEIAEATEPLARNSPFPFKSTVVWVYILQSQSSGRYYVGVSERPEERLAEHNRGQTVSTKGRGPWVKVWQEAHADLKSASAREREIKGWKSRSKITELVRRD